MGYGMRDTQSTLRGRKFLILCIEENLNRITRNNHHGDTLYIDFHVVALSIGAR